MARLGRAAAVLGRQPYLQRVQANSASVLWTTAQAGSGSVVVTSPSGATSSFAAVGREFQPSDTQMPSAYYQYRADIAGLQEGVAYQYQVLMDGQLLASDPANFRFRTPTAESFSFLAFGDSGTDSAEQKSLIQLMDAEPGVSKVIHVGDLAYESGTFAQLEDAYFGQNASLMSRLPFFATPGNHDYETNSALPYLAGHVPPDSKVPAADLGRYYSFDWSDAHFVALDSNLLVTADAASRMLSWLDADLAASPKYWKIVFLHHPPYPTGFHVGDPICALVEQNVNPVLEKHGVQLVLSGHEHGYERTWPLSAGEKAPSNSPSTTYVITGGGGGALEAVGSLPQCALSLQAFHYLRVDVSGPALTLTATGLDGNAIDRVTLNPPPFVALNGVLNAGDFSPAIAPGSLVSLFGQNLALRPAAASTFPLPDSLGGISATANGIPVPLLYVSPGQINLQMPFEVSGQVNLQVTTPNGAVPASVTVAPTAPSILAMTSQNGLVSVENPVQPGGYVTLYVTGLGAPADTIATGQAAPGRAVPTIAQVQLLLGNMAIQPSYAGLAPGFAGVNQINFAIPGSLPAGVYPLRVVAGQATSAQAALNVAASTANQSASPAGNPQSAESFHPLAGLRIPAASIPIHTSAAHT